MNLDQLNRLARRHVRSVEEAEDVVQDVLLAAVQAGRPLADPTFAPWAAGAIRRRAAFIARSAGRRRRREQDHLIEPSRAALRLPRTFVDGLPPSLRILGLLLNLGLTRDEIRYLLGIGDGALRQRLTALRGRWEAAGETPDTHGADPVFSVTSPGLSRRALLKRLPAAEAGLTLGCHDPDGHPLIISTRRSQSVLSRQQEGEHADSKETLS